MKLKIQRAESGNYVIFNLSGRMKAELLAELQRLFELEGIVQNMVLDLKEVTLVDRDAVRFLAQREEDGTRLTNCPSHIRALITIEACGTLSQSGGSPEPDAMEAMNEVIIQSVRRFDG
jgi:anti-anti-sigma regulatory factor